MAREFDKEKRPSRGPCVAPGCDRHAIIATKAGLCCNMHYLRLLYHDAFELPEKARLQDVACGCCGKQFDRGYTINSKRAAKPQYCSAACRAAAKKAAALSGLADRFWANVDKRGADECWLWTGRPGTNGYGAFDNGGRPHIASRFAYTLQRGGPGDLLVCHTCDNPPCCNPAHLFLGTHQDNMDDMARKGRRRNPCLKGEAHGSAKLTEQDVIHIRNCADRNVDLAQKYRVTPEAISAIRRRKLWRHV